MHDSLSHLIVVLHGATICLSPAQNLLPPLHYLIVQYPTLVLPDQSHAHLQLNHGSSMSHMNAHISLCACVGSTQDQPCFSTLHRLHLASSNDTIDLVGHNVCEYLPAAS